MGRMKDAWRVLTARKQPPSPPKPARRTPSRFRASPATMGYAAGWRPGAGDIFSLIDKSLSITRNRARDLDDAAGVARRIFDAYANAVVGPGIRPTIDVGDAKARHPVTGKTVRLDDLIYEAWDKWVLDPSNGFPSNFYGLQWTACRTERRDGEFLCQLRRRMTGDLDPLVPPLQLEPLDANQLPIAKTEINPVNGNRIINGVEVDGIGRVVAYHLYVEPQDSIVPWTLVQETKRVLAENMIHLFRAEAPGQLRGRPFIGPVLMDIENLDAIEEAVQVGTRAANNIALVITKKEVPKPEFKMDGSPVDPFPATDANGSQVYDDTGHPEHESGPGLVVQGNPDEDLELRMPQMPQGLADFQKGIIRKIAMGVSMTYSLLAMDMQGSSFAQERLGLIEFDKSTTVYRDTAYLPTFLDPFWRAWIKAGIDTRKFPDDPRLYNVRWSKPKNRSADEITDTKADLLAMQSMTKSLSEVIESTGRDPETVIKQCAKDRDLCRKYGLVPLWDLEQVSTSGTAQANAILNEPANPTETNPPNKP